MAAKKTAMTLDEKKGRLNALRQLLDSTDYKAIKHSEGLISDDEYAETKEQRQAWRGEINTLQAEITEDELQE